MAGDDARLEREIERSGAALDEVVQAPNGMAELEPILDGAGRDRAPG